jgi:glutamate-1-semialdehyde 2,1-aminomutase
MDRALTCIVESAIDRLIGGPSHWMRRGGGGFPVCVESAKGVRIIDMDGISYVDLCCGGTGGMCGRGPGAVRSTAQLAHSASDMLPTEDSVWVGNELARRPALPYWTLTTSAADANRAAIRADVERYDEVFADLVETAVAEDAVKP